MLYSNVASVTAQGTGTITWTNTTGNSITLADLNVSISRANGLPCEGNSGLVKIEINLGAGFIILFNSMIGGYSCQNLNYTLPDVIVPNNGQVRWTFFNGSYNEWRFSVNINDKPENYKLVESRLIAKEVLNVTAGWNHPVHTYTFTNTRKVCGISVGIIGANLEAFPYTVLNYMTLTRNGITTTRYMALNGQCNNLFQDFFHPIEFITGDTIYFSLWGYNAALNDVCPLASTILLKIYEELP